VLLYRISKSKYARDLSGDGARIAGGRWNLNGTPVIYTSDSTALATLEALVHTPLNLMPKDISITTFELSNNLRIDKLPYSRLPKNWQTYPAPVQLARIGTDWLSKGTSVALAVPSSVTPSGEGKNYLLNPRHPDFKKIKIQSVVPYIFNDRLLKK
jgi:RES domain-containing protein